MDKITSGLADYASNLRFKDADDVTIFAAIGRLVDSIGCALGAYNCEPAQIGRRLAAGQSSGKFPGRTLCYADRLPAEAAAFVNTTMIRNLDFNDRYPGGHPSDCLGPLMALAGAMHIDGKRFLTSMIAAYEIFARLSDAGRLSRRGWDQGHAVGIATATGVCNLLGLSRDVTANAVGIAAASIVPLRVTRSGELTPWKNAATAFAARNGLFAALLAAEGMVGPGEAFAGRDGLFDKITGPFDLAPFPSVGGAPLTPRVQLKYWPVETNAQPVIWAALKLREFTTADALQDIEVFTSKFTWFEIGSEPEKWDPRTPETADHSLPYIFARALVDGPITVGSFRTETVLDPSLRPLMSRIRVTVDEKIEALLPNVSMRVRATAKDGAIHEVEVGNPLGHPANAMQDEHIAEKFRTLATPTLGSERCEVALAGWREVVAAANIGQLMDLLDVDPTAVSLN